MTLQHHVYFGPHFLPMLRVPLTISFSPASIFLSQIPFCGSPNLALLSLGLTLQLSPTGHVLFAVCLATFPAPFILQSGDNRGIGPWRSFHTDNLCTRPGQDRVTRKYCEFLSLWEELYCIYTQLSVLWEGPGTTPEAGQRSSGKYGVPTPVGVFFWGGERSDEADAVCLDLFLFNYIDIVNSEPSKTLERFPHIHSWNFPIQEN